VLSRFLIQHRLISKQHANDCEKDLGIWMTSQCSRKAYAKAMQSLATIKGSFKYIIKDSFNILYKTYIRPHIEYCIQAWNPYYAKDIVVRKI